MKLPFSRKPGGRATLAGRLRQLALIVALAGFCLYLIVITGGYLWLRFGRKVEQVRFLDCAFLNVRGMRRSIAVQQFAQGKKELAAKNYQAAYVAYASAIRQDPDNVPGRLEVADFFRQVGAPALAQSVMEEGLALAPQDRRLIEPAFDLLITTGRDRQALKLLHSLYPIGFTGPNALTLQTYEVFATLTADGPAPARQLLARYPELQQHLPAAPIVARVFWESADQTKAVALLAKYVRTQSTAVYADFVRLAGWQLAAGQNDEAVRTAERACGKFPADLGARVLLIEMRSAASADGRPVLAEVEDYLRKYGARPEALTRLAVLAGNKGWVDLTRILYELGVARQGELRELALHYSDALMTSSRFAEAVPMLAQVEAQAPEGDVGFMVQLRQRQVIAAAATGDTSNVREFARRLGSVIGNNPEGLDICRRLFLKLDIPDAVAELTPHVAKPVPAAAPRKV